MFNSLIDIDDISLLANKITTGLVNDHKIKSKSKKKIIPVRRQFVGTQR